MDSFFLEKLQGYITAREKSEKENLAGSKIETLKNRTQLKCASNSGDIVQNKF